MKIVSSNIKGTLTIPIEVRKAMNIVNINGKILFSDITLSGIVIMSNATILEMEPIKFSNEMLMLGQHLIEKYSEN